MADSDSKEPRMTLNDAREVMRTYDEKRRNDYASCIALMVYVRLLARLEIKAKHYSTEFPEYDE